MSSRAASRFSLVLADVDGTLVTTEKVLTAQAVSAVNALHAAGVGLAITRGRPPRGMADLIAPLALRTPIAGFNGGVFVNPDLKVIESRALDPATAGQAVDLFLHKGLDVWVCTEDEWLIRDQAAAHVARETWTVKFDARVVASFTNAHLSPIELIEFVLHLCDIVLVMTVRPGFGGQKFLTRGLDPFIEVDGGENRESAGRAIEAGATAIVAGSAIFGSHDYSAAIAALRDARPPSAMKAIS